MASDALWFYLVKRISGDMPQKIFKENLPSHYVTVPVNQAENWEFRVGQQAMLFWTEEQIEKAFEEKFGMKPTSISKSPKWYERNDPDDWVIAFFDGYQRRRMTRLETDMFAILHNENVLVYEKKLIAKMEHASDFLSVCQMSITGIPMIKDSLLSWTDNYISAKKDVSYDDETAFLPIVALMRARNAIKNSGEYIIVSDK